jgi:4-diphosphocytidyl-2-C-methyl-D-erythritol kinase
VWGGSAPAKVNLRLEISAPRDDGYHPVETVLQTLDLADDLRLSVRADDQVTLELTGVPSGALGPDADNLAVRAADAMRRALAACGRQAPGVTIHLHKRIPHGAGLGGGSSDAAAVLRGMNELLGRPFDTGDLLPIAAHLGSDVPFLVLDRPRALAWGRGEKTLGLPALPVRPVLIAVPREPIATGWAYRALDAHRDSLGSHSSHSGAPSIASATEGTVWEGVAARAHNDFEGALFLLRPDLGRIKKILEGAGARPALLSGSGSALFGVFEDDDGVARAEAAVSGEAAGAAADGGPSTDTALEGLRTYRTRTRG